MISSDDIRKTLGAIEAMAPVADRLSDEADLFDNGLCSFGSVQLMLALEERYDIEFPDHLLNRHAFATIRAIRATVSSLAQPGAR